MRKLKSAGYFFPVLFVLTACAIPSWFSNAEPELKTQPVLATTGSAFFNSIKMLDHDQREIEIRRAVLRGDIPSFLQHFQPITFREQNDQGHWEVEFRVAPDYLAIGTNTDFMRVPVAGDTAKVLAEEMGYMLPTRKMVNAIYQFASVRLVPQPLPPGPQMVSSEYYRRHNLLIQTQLGGLTRPWLGQIVAGHKKDIVLTNRLIKMPSRVAIFGWHETNGHPIQPLSLVHGIHYVDYSHGVRLVDNEVKINRRSYRLNEVLSDPRLSFLFSDEGPIAPILQPKSHPRLLAQLPFTPLAHLPPPHVIAQ